LANFKTQQLDVKLTNSVSINVLPETGHILPFAGPSNKIPSGWVLCDGTNGTPDLRGKLPGGISNVSVGSNQTHSHTFTNTLGSFNTATVSPSANITAANEGANQNTGAHNANAYFGNSAWGDSGPANRSNGSQANVIGRNHTHGGTTNSSVNFNTGSQSPNHTHGFTAYSINATSSNSHSHTITSSPTVNTQTLIHTSLPSIFYVNFIMKV
jgi:hypothetical protein